jgi:hypothetical protein
MRGDGWKRRTAQGAVVLTRKITDSSLFFRAARPALAGRPSGHSRARDRSGAQWREALVLTSTMWLFVLMLYLPILANRHPEDGWSSVAIEGSTVLLAIALGMVLYGVARATEAWLLGMRISALAITILIAAIVQTTIDYAFTYWVAINFKPHWSTALPKLERSYGAAFTYVCVFGANLALFLLVFWRRQAVSREDQLMDARSAAHHAQLMALRFQLNPHFLFNTLNAISSMIVTGRNADAEEMTEKLSRFLRGSLASDPAALVPLETELAMIEEYLDIESVRFGDRLNVEMACARDALPIPVPSFLLQPLVENAIKYGVGPSAAPVTIRISAAVQDGQLVLGIVDDGGTGLDALPPSGTGVGLDNIRNRLHAIYGGGAALNVGPEVAGFGARIRIPLDPPRARERSRGPLDQRSLSAIQEGEGGTCGY